MNTNLSKQPVQVKAKKSTPVLTLIKSYAQSKGITDTQVLRFFKDGERINRNGTLGEVSPSFIFESLIYAGWDCRR